MSDSVPFYVYANIKKATETSAPTFAKIKSKSNEDLTAPFERDNAAYKSAKPARKPDKSMRDYNVKVAKENLLRERTIKELLLENEAISKKLLDSTGDPPRPRQFNPLTNRLQLTTRRPSTKAAPTGRHEGTTTRRGFS